MINFLLAEGVASTGVMIAVVGWIIVFAALLVLVFIFQLIPTLLTLQIRDKLKRRAKNKKIDSSEIQLDSNVNAAIATAISLYFSEAHDNESNIITIQSAPKQYSPWSSKIYGVQNNLKK